LDAQYDRADLPQKPTFSCVGIKISHTTQNTHRIYHALGEE
jgi:hypothetical protein